MPPAATAVAARSRRSRRGAASLAEREGALILEEEPGAVATPSRRGQGAKRTVPAPHRATRQAPPACRGGEHRLYGPRAGLSDRCSGRLEGRRRAAERARCGRHCRRRGEGDGGVPSRLTLAAASVRGSSALRRSGIRPGTSVEIDGSPDGGGREMEHRAMVWAGPVRCRRRRPPLPPPARAGDRPDRRAERADQAPAPRLPLGSDNSPAVPPCRPRGGREPLASAR